jgi:hypothetical protein
VVLRSSQSLDATTRLSCVTIPSAAVPSRHSPSAATHTLAHTHTQTHTLTRTRASHRTHGVPCRRGAEPAAHAILTFVVSRRQRQGMGLPHINIQHQAARPTAASAASLGSASLFSTSPTRTELCAGGTEYHAPDSISARSSCPTPIAVQAHTAAIAWWASANGARGEDAPLMQCQTAQTLLISLDAQPQGRKYLTFGVFRSCTPPGPISMEQHSKGTC